MPFPTNSIGFGAPGAVSNIKKRIYARILALQDLPYLCELREVSAVQAANEDSVTVRSTPWHLPSLPYCPAEQVLTCHGHCLPLARPQHLCQQEGLHESR